MAHLLVSKDGQARGTKFVTMVQSSARGPENNAHTYGAQSSAVTKIHITAHFPHDCAWIDGPIWI